MGPDALPFADLDYQCTDGTASLTGSLLILHPASNEFVG